MSSSLVFYTNKLNFKNFCIFYFQEDLSCVYLFSKTLKKIGNLLIYSNLERKLFLLIAKDLMFFLEKNNKMSLSIFARNYARRAFLILQEVFKGFCIEFRIYGLGFRLIRSSKNLTKVLIFDIGYSHLIYFKLPPKMLYKKLKRRFIFICYDFQTLNIVLKQIKLLKTLSPYKLRGLSITKEIFKIKPGKKQKHK